ncbi:PilW family protein [Sulfurihydrogenibium subterraneum]|uniref:PilW family protein n=1 Tax=Sulfurihydrogenibium subterraneum TaxID=171121 RepID=UPI00048D1D0B|nr:prepilin-type N-terminal cleavage/methylation domain-containing protein [Sulfurihydrogenibium subterraneum]
MKKGYTIIELLVVIALSLIIGAGFYTFYTTVVRENISKSSLAKKEQDVSIFVEQIIKDFQSIGFGVDYDKLKIKDGVGCDLSADNPVLTKCSTNNTVSFLSLASTDQVNSGCWGFIDINGKIKMYNSYDTLGRLCSDIAEKYLILNTSKKLIDSSYSYNPSSPNTNYKNSYAFYIGNSNYPNYFKVKYYMDNTNLPKECAPGTYNLQKSTTTTSPIISCVLNFQIKYIGIDNNFYDTFTLDTDPYQNLKKLQGLKLCMIVQVGGRQSTPENPRNYTSNQGCASFDFSTNPDWRYYRWVIIEQTIPLKNIH